MKSVLIQKTKHYLRIFLLLICCSLGTGCNEPDDTTFISWDETPNTATEEIESNIDTFDPAETSYVFYCRQRRLPNEKPATIALYPGMTVTDTFMGMKPDDSTEQLPEPLSIYEAPSCALPGMDIIYTYSSYELTVYREDDSVLTSIRLTDDSYTTAEGICIGSTAAEVLDVYGDTTPISGEYRYPKGEMELSILTRNQVVTSIEYRLMTDNKEN